MRSIGISAISLAWALLQTASLSAQPVEVRQREGAVRGFLIIRNTEGAIIADGDSTQVTRGGQVTNRLVFHFKDGSLQDETVVFSQSGHFRVLSDHLVQKGPTFKHATDMLINGVTGQVTVRSTDDKGQEKVESAHLNLPPDLANGIVPVVLGNLPPGTQTITESMVVATPKPLLVKLVVNVEGEDSFTAGNAKHKATRYVIKVDIPGIRGVVAPLVGKQPQDARVWISEGTSPCFLKSEGPSFDGGPMWHIELVSPAWPQPATGTADRKK